MVDPLKESLPGKVNSVPRARATWVTGFIGVLLILAGLVCNPLGYFVLNGGAHLIGSEVFRYLAWGAGAALAGTGVLLFLRRRVISPKDLLLFSGSCAACLVFMELGLWAVGLNSPYPFTRHVPELVPWFTYSQETGTRFIPGKFTDPNWPINSDGFPGTAEFTADACSKADTRILLLGDSFTFGVAASQYEHSYASILEQRLRTKRNVVAWNTGISGIGQKQELLSLRTYFPILRPQIVTLGFCMNDFDDNMFPMSEYYVFEGDRFIFRYERLPDGAIRTLSPKEAYLRAHPLSEWLSASRVVYQAFGVARALQLRIDTRRGQTVAPPLQGLDAAVAAVADPHMRGVAETKELLREIKEYVESHQAHLVLLLIPFKSDLDVPSRRYQVALSLFKDLGIDCLDTREFLTKENYILPSSPHWDDAGHLKVAEALAARIEAIFDAREALPPGK